MDFTLHKSQLANKKSEITLTGSKSESNRLLLLQALYPEFKLENVSNSDDSNLMAKALGSNEKTIDIHHAGNRHAVPNSVFRRTRRQKNPLNGLETHERTPH